LLLFLFLSLGSHWEGISLSLNSRLWWECNVVILFYRLLWLCNKLLLFEIRWMFLRLQIILTTLIFLWFSIKLFRFRVHLKLTLKTISRHITPIKLYKPLFMCRFRRLSDHRKSDITQNSLITISHHLIMIENLHRIKKSHNLYQWKRKITSGNSQYSNQHVLGKWYRTHWRIERG
jgi:hypothetical protein